MKMISKTLSTISAGSILFASFAGSAIAQGQYGDQYDDRSNYVTVYEDCEFRGNSRTVSVGDFSKMRDLDFGNDKMSSIRVPRDMEVTIYRDDKFRGDYARVDRDIYCFDKQWNDKVSSLRVRSTRRGYSDDDRYQDRRDDERRPRYSDDQRRYDNRNENRNVYGYPEQRGRDNRSGDKNVTAKNVSQVVFANRVLQQTGKRKWQIADQRTGVSQYKEVSRDKNTVYLQNNYTREKVRIDLFANDVTFIAGNGQRQTYAIQRKQAALNSKPSNNQNTAGRNSREPSTLIRSSCFNYKAYTTGGQGGIRFHGHDGFHQFGKKAHTGRICDTGEVTMEINKTQPGTNAIVEVNGRKFRFAANEKHDVYLNTWYRKKITLTLKPR